MRKILQLLVVLGVLILPGCSTDGDPNPAGITIAPPGATVFDFESDLESWVSENADMTATHNTNPAYVLNGSGSVKGACDISGAVPDDARVLLRYQPGAALDMTGLTLQFYVYIPSSLAGLSQKYGSKLWLYTDTWREIEGPEIDTSGWNHFTFSPSGIGENSVTVVSFQIYKDDGTEDDWAGDLYFDYISW